MESSTEESDSRTAAFSKKRKQPGSSLQLEHNDSEGSDKRVKFDQLRDKYDTLEPGEISDATSIKWRPSKDAAGTTGSHGSQNAEPSFGTMTQSGWTPINDARNYDPFINPDQYGPAPSAAPVSSYCTTLAITSQNGHGSNGTGSIASSAKATGSRRRGLRSGTAAASIDGRESHHSEHDRDPILQQLQNDSAPTKEEYGTMARWLQRNGPSLTLHDIQHAGLKGRVKKILEVNNMAEQPGVAKTLEMISQGREYHSIVRTFLRERYMAVRGSHTGPTGAESPLDAEKTNDLVSPQSPEESDGATHWAYSGAPLEASINAQVRSKIQTGKELSQHDYLYMADWLHDNHASPKLDDIKDTRLKGKIHGMMQTTRFKKFASIAPLLAHQVKKRGSVRKAAWALLAECYVSALYEVASGNGEFAANGMTTTLEPASAANKDHNAGTVGLVSLEDITRKALRKHVSRRTSRETHKSIEEMLREAVVGKEKFCSQAKQTLTEVYGALEKYGPRLGILQSRGPESWSLHELETAMKNTGGFLRPMIASDLIDRTSQSIFPAVVVTYMQSKEDASFAQGLLQAAKDNDGDGFARHCLAEFMAVNYVGGKCDTSIHSREGFEIFIQFPRIGETSNLLESTSEDAAALTLQEIEYILPESTAKFSEKEVLDSARTIAYTGTFWKSPESPFNHAVAHRLVQLIKAGTTPPNARVHLNQFIQAFRGGRHTSSNEYHNVVMQQGDPIQYLPGQPHVQPSTRAEAKWPNTNTESDAADRRLHELAELEQTLFIPKVFSRTMQVADLGTDEAFVTMVQTMSKEVTMRLEDVVLYLCSTTGVSGIDYTDLARTVLKQYVKTCHHPVTLPPPPATCDYGEMARKAAASVSTPDDIAGDDEDNEEKYSTGQLDVHEGSAKQQNHSKEYESLQKRYFHITVPESTIRCLCCGEEGHSEDSCPSLTCDHCGAKDEHFSGACPVNQKCGRCRQRGHSTTQCTVLSSSLMRSLNDECDVCGRPDHVEEECPDLWHSRLGDNDMKVLVPQQDMHVNCYNCGGNSRFYHSTHWGDDCPRMDRHTQRANLNPTFSKKHADKFILSSISERQPKSVGHGNIPRHQLALLDD